ncbi:hypothetical protein EZY14_013335 [Kordia sp. TARA_039_SRF]|nr:hypothetical protein EZY14_013335 [Kordia sp. TARA_039_SRF]
MKHDKRKQNNRHQAFADSLLQSIVEEKKQSAEKDQEIQKLLSKLDANKNISAKEIVRIIKEELKG